MQSQGFLVSFVGGWREPEPLGKQSDAEYLSITAASEQLTFVVTYY